jgi:mannose-6-phosphate isomerase
MTKEKPHTTHTKPGALRVGCSAPLRRTRRAMRRLYHATRRSRQAPKHHKGLHVYENVDEFAAVFLPPSDQGLSKQAALTQVKTMIDQLNYTIVEANETKPWGGMYRLADEQAGRFIAEFFPGLTLHDAKLGRHDVQLSPKFILLEPGKRLSWQYHRRRAERWHFITAGFYYKNQQDDLPAPVFAPAGTIVQLVTADRHRIGGADKMQYTLVAEVWQHTDPTHLSDEADIVRLQDDYQRVPSASRP